MKNIHNETPVLNYDFDFKRSMPKVQNNFKLPLQKSLLIKSADVFEIACPNNSVKRRKTLSRLDRIFFFNVFSSMD